MRKIFRQNFFVPLLSSSFLVPFSLASLIFIPPFLNLHSGRSSRAVESEGIFNSPCILRVQGIESAVPRLPRLTRSCRVAILFLVFGFLSPMNQCHPVLHSSRPVLTVQITSYERQLRNIWIFNWHDFQVSLKQARIFVKYLMIGI